MAMTSDKMGGMERLINFNAKLEDLLDDATVIDTLFNGLPELKNIITNEDLAEVTAYSGINQALVQDNAFAIGGIRTAILNAMVSIAIISRKNRA